jgi:transposase
LLLTPGNVHDSARFAPLYRLVEPDNVVTALAADKANASRDQLARDALEAVIPSSASRATVIPHDQAIYQERNRIERCFNKLKHFRRIATRYDQLAASCLALVHLVAAFIFARNS